MTEIFLIRHGETDWNTQRRLQGHVDIPLNAEGVRQAAALAQALRNEGLDAVVASDLQRALHTAQAIADVCGLSVQIELGLRERCYGAFEGLNHADIKERYPQDYLAWQTRHLDARFPKGEREAETLREFSARAVGALVRLASASAYRKIAVVTHGGVLECIYRTAKQIGWASPRDFDIRNAGINRLTWDGERLHVVQWSDVAHLNAALDEIDK
jgi:probable phosphoglycerate mutase